MTILQLLSVAIFLSAECAYAQSIPYDSLRRQLDTIENDDQKYRLQLDPLKEKFANDSVGLNAALNRLWRDMGQADSLNLVKVTAIIDKYGWLGPDVIGETGNSTLFIVIQHAHLDTQKKYLPIMGEAVARGKARARSLALLEDRVALREGRRQIYGSQVYVGMNGAGSYVLPLEDPENVDKRRAAVGLEPLSDYLKNFNMTWNLEKYKRDLPAIEALQAKMPK